MIKFAHFLFCQSDVMSLKRQLAKTPREGWPQGVISCTPGIDLSSLESLAGDTIDLCTSEDLLDRFDISQTEIAEHCTAITKAHLGDLAEIDGLNPVRILPNTQVLLVYYPVVLQLIFERLAAEGLTEVRLPAGNARAFSLIDLYIPNLARPDLVFRAHLIDLCRVHGVEWRMTGWSVPGFSRATNICRNALIYSYKVWRLICRSYMTIRYGRSGSVFSGLALSPEPETSGDKRSVLVVIRARTELETINPVIEALRDDPNLIVRVIADDLIKSPTGIEAVEGSGLDWVPAHAFSTPNEIIRLALEIPGQVARSIRVGMGQAMPPLCDRLRFFERHDVRWSSLQCACQSMFELVLFSRQLSRAITACQPVCIVTMDYIDRWGAVAGTVGRTHNVPVLTIQNAALPDRIWPEPLTTDAAVVANRFVKEILVRSGGPPDAIHDAGLPLNDVLINKGDAIIAARRAIDADPLRVVIATQPFTDALDFNGKLLEALAAAGPDLSGYVEYIIKPHPRETPDKYCGQVEQLEAPRATARIVNDQLEKTLDEADFLIARTSNSLQCALLCGVSPIAYVNNTPAGVISGVDFLATPATIKVADPKSLATFIIRMSNPVAKHAYLSSFALARDAYLKEFGGAAAGHATAFTVDLIRQMAGLQSVGLSTANHPLTRAARSHELRP